MNSRADLQAALDEIGYPAVLKTCEGGYDGHGQIVLRSAADLERVWGDDGFPSAILEGFVDFAFEASILVSATAGGMSPSRSYATCTGTTSCT